MWSLLRQWWFSEAALVPGGLVRVQGAGPTGEGERGDPNGRGGGFAAGLLDGASQDATFHSEPQETHPWPSHQKIQGRWF